jgi:hypothetical protein
MYEIWSASSVLAFTTTCMLKTLLIQLFMKQMASLHDQALGFEL